MVEAITMLKQVLQVTQGIVVDDLPEEAQAMLKAIRGDDIYMKLDAVWKELQQHVDHVLDRDMNRGSAKGNTWGFKQVIERKQGLFRMNMMGKRVNFAARTVITPDPNLSIDEIGLPEVFAKKLTYRTPVTHWNVEELRQAVINGPDVHPGKVFVLAMFCTSCGIFVLLWNFLYIFLYLLYNFLYLLYIFCTFCTLFVICVHIPVLSVQILVLFLHFLYIHLCFLYNSCT